MTNEALKVLRAARFAKLDQIARDVGNFKECDQCRAIAPKHSGLCPWCKSYRFKEATQRVRATLRVMRRHLWPVNAGVVPRITPEHSPGDRSVRVD